ncbi:uncharacterized protein LOC144470949 [Augochlora pura]
MTMKKKEIVTRKWKIGQKCWWDRECTKQNRKYSEGPTRKKLKELIKKVWNGEGFPEDWKRAGIMANYKKGNAEVPENYRAILNERLRKDVEQKGILPDTQSRFRKHRGTIDNGYILHHVAERKTLKNKRKVYALFVDLEAAFDAVKRGKFWEALAERGVRKGLIERIKEIYTETRNVVKTSDGVSEEFWTGEGLRQGARSVHHCTLFSWRIWKSA